MPGQLIHTNEILVLLGDNWFAETSARQAQDIVARRVKGTCHRSKLLIICLLVLCDHEFVTSRQKQFKHVKLVSVYLSYYNWAWYYIHLVLWQCTVPNIFPELW